MSNTRMNNTAAVEAAKNVAAECRGMKDLYLDLEGRIEKLRYMVCEIGDLSDAADIAEGLALVLRGIEIMGYSNEES